MSDEEIRKEVVAFNKIMKALLRLDPEDRPRVLRFLYDKYMDKAS